MSHGYLINHNSIKQTIIYSSVKLQIGLQLLQPNCYRIFRSLILLLTLFIFTHFRWIQAEWCGQNRVSFWHVDGSYSNMQGTTLPQIAAIFQLFQRGQDPLKKDLKFWCQSCCCQETHCPFPGYLTHGKVLLVGHMGLYDYRKVL